MSRVVLDCRDWPGTCTLVLSGTEEEVIDAAVLHTTTVHAQTDGPQLREMLRRHFRPEPEWLGTQLDAPSISA